MNTAGIKPAQLGEGAPRSAFSRIFENEYIFLFSGFILTCFACYAYFIVTGNGLRAIYGDSWVYTDLAKRIAFNHSLLHEDYANRVIYPPLYPLLISAAYLFRDQNAIFEAIKTLNILAYSSAFFPMFHLLKHYAGLSRNQSYAGAILLLMNWCSLCYVIYISSEPLFFPLLIWLAWFLADSKHLNGKTDLLLFIILFSAIPLTKAAGNLVFPCFAGAMIIKLIYARNNHQTNGLVMLIRRSIIVLIASAVIITLYNMYIKSMLPKNQGDIPGGYLAVILDPQEMRTLLKPSYWLDRIAFSFSWVLIGSGTVAIPLLLSIVIRNKTIFLEDALVFFSLAFLAGTFVLVPLVTTSDALGGAFGRYYDPLLFVFVVMLLKYARMAEMKDVAIAGLITFTGVIIAPPLSIHASCFALYKPHPLAVNMLLYGGGGAVFISMLVILHLFKKHFINIFFVMMAISIPALHFLDYLGGNKLGPNTFSFYDAHGITREVLSERAMYPETGLIVDRSWRHFEGGFEVCDYWEYWKILINLPMVPAYKDLTTYLPDPHTKGNRFMVLSHQNLANALKIVKGKEISLYIFGH